jgi:hypothetical protein
MQASERRKPVDLIDLAIVKCSGGVQEGAEKYRRKGKPKRSRSHSGEMDVFERMTQLNGLQKYRRFAGVNGAKG